MAGSSWDESRCANPAGGDRRKFEYGPEQMLPLSTGRGSRARSRVGWGARLDSHHHDGAPCISRNG